MQIAAGARRKIRNRQVCALEFGRLSLNNFRGFFCIRAEP
jgi:hypothetical protein